ncbi:protein SNORC [Microcaecilia unicolor]|uniref:Protein SNORC n=1 Tax=Microcaecilia unicolor TaxID=1415580 RepID=A0A6P7Z6N2_9AMPH|nr:protein SNORC [Microcaecilia unicolor]
MSHLRFVRLILLTLFGVLVSAVLTGGYPVGPAPTLWNDPSELPSGGGPIDSTTTAAHFSDITGIPFYTTEDTTQLYLENGDGSLGPGAIATIVIAALLGTSVVVALIVITLRKFSTS